MQAASLLQRPGSSLISRPVAPVSQTETRRRAGRRTSNVPAGSTRHPGHPMGLFGRKKTTIGLDIGSGLIKVAVIDHGRGEPELTKVAIAPLLADAIVEGEIMDPGIVADAIRAALSAGGSQGQEHRHRRRRPRRDHQEDPDRARQGAAGARAHAVGGRAACAVRHGVGRARLPDSRSRCRRPAR